jgi:hypothetical protein
MSDLEVETNSKGALLNDETVMEPVGVQSKCDDDHDKEDACDSKRAGDCDTNDEYDDEDDEHDDDDDYDDDDDDHDDDDDYNDDADEDTDSVYYEYVSYESYISPAGKRYKKHEATVPDELLIPYIEAMDYKKFEMPDCVIELDDWSAKFKRYRTHEITKKKISLSESNDRVYKKILRLIKRPEVDNVVCRRPSYIYTSGHKIGNDCCYDSDDMENVKFTETGAREVHFDPRTNTFERC